MVPACFTTDSYYMYLCIIFVFFVRPLTTRYNKEGKVHHMKQSYHVIILFPTRNVQHPAVLANISSCYILLQNSHELRLQQNTWRSYSYIQLVIQFLQVAAVYHNCVLSLFLYSVLFLSFCVAIARALLVLQQQKKLRLYRHFWIGQITSPCQGIQ